MKGYSLICAYAKTSRGIGFRGTIPWSIPDEMKHFKKITTCYNGTINQSTNQENIVIMGRKTWDSLSPKYKPLVNRKNYIISKQMSMGSYLFDKAKNSLERWHPEDDNNSVIEVVNDYREAIELIERKHGLSNCFNIGGSQLYTDALKDPKCIRLYLTEINDDTNKYEPNKYETNKYETNKYETNKYDTNKYETNKYETNKYDTNKYDTFFPAIPQRFRLVSTEEVIAHGKFLMNEQSISDNNIKMRYMVYEDWTDKHSEEHNYLNILREIIGGRSAPCGSNMSDSNMSGSILNSTSSGSTMSGSNMSGSTMSGSTLTKNKQNIRPDRTGIGTIALFGRQMRFSLANNVMPLLTTKRVYWKGVVEELLFFLRGDHDNRKLQAQNVHIWDGNTTREYLDKYQKQHIETHDLGLAYGVQWRASGAKLGNINTDYRGKGIDQLAELIANIKNDPYSRRLIINAWNVPQLEDMALVPCHMMYQFFVDFDNNEFHEQTKTNENEQDKNKQNTNKQNTNNETPNQQNTNQQNRGKLSCMMTQRSCDMFLGVPFNIASCALLTHIIAKTCGLDAHEIIVNMGDAHIYQNHMDQVQEQLKRECFRFPTIEITKSLESVADIEALTFNDIKLNQYHSWPTIKAEMAI